MNTFELSLNDKAIAKRGKMMDKLSRCEEKLRSVISFCEAQPSYLQNRFDDSVSSFTKRLEALEREEEEAVAEFRKKYQARRENIKERLEEVRKRQEKQKSLKPREIHAAETAVKIILEEMDSHGLLSPKERQRLWELRADPTAPAPPSNTSPEPQATPEPPKEEELPLDVKEYLTERGTMPANREEIDLFKERKAMLQEMAREKRDRERDEENKRLDAIEKLKLRKEAEKQKDEEKKIVTFEKEESSDSEDEENEESSESELDEEEYKKLVIAQKAELRRKHEERMKKQQSFYTPPVPEVQEFPTIVSNTKAKKPIKMLKK